VPGSDWTVGDVAAHLALGTEAYLGYATGDTDPFVDVSDVAGGSLTRTSQARLDAEPERDLAALAERIEVAVTALLRASEDRAGDEVVTWNGQKVSLGAMLGIAVAEYVLHGQDMAQALSRPWTIRPDDARLVLASALPMLPLLVDPVATKDVRATYDLRVRGGARVTVAIDHGALAVVDADETGVGRAPDKAGSGSADCRISADPVALLLVAYGRTSQWRPILTDKLVAWGRRPWLGLRFVRYLVVP